MLRPILYDMKCVLGNIVLLFGHSRVDQLKADFQQIQHAYQSYKQRKSAAVSEARLEPAAMLY